MLFADISDFDSIKTGVLIAHLSSDVEDVRGMIKHSINIGLRNTLNAVGGLAALIMISPKLTLVMSTIGPVMVMAGSVFGSQLRVFSKQVKQQEAELNAYAQEILSNIRTVRAFACGEFELGRFRGKCEKSTHLATQFAMLVSVFYTMTSVYMNGCILGGLWVGRKLTQTGDVSSGDLASFMLLTMRLQGSISQLSVLFGEVTKGMAAAERVVEFVNKKPLIPHIGGLTPKGCGRGGCVTFDGIDFTYPTRTEKQVFKGLTLELEPNKVTALVGPSGAGKSTIASLLERFYDPDNGVVTLDGHDIRTLDPSWLRSDVLGIVTQEPVLFSGTIMENIKYGRPDATEEEVVAAACIANAHEFITQFPDGYDTKVGERGQALSGGQKQRVAIARAVLKDPSVLILDEATSALDSVSEREVQVALDKLMKGRTTLVIAHRLSTIRDAAKIAVIKDGAVAEQGTHAQLMAKGGDYTALVKHQIQNDTQE